MSSWLLGTVLGVVFPVVLILFAMMRNRHEGNLMVLAMPGIPLLMICPVLGALIAIFVPWWIILSLAVVAILLFWNFGMKSSQRSSVRL